MPSLADVFRELNSLKATGLVRDYAIGGATAVLFYAEPTRTYDVDVFITIEAPTASPLVSLSSLYDWARSRQFAVDAEHILIHGVPVQFLPAHNALAEDAVATARTMEYEGVAVRVVDPEHLAALAFQAGGARRRERAWQLLETGGIDEVRLQALLAAHGIKRGPDDAS
jgi:hypothetical protein